MAFRIHGDLHVIVVGTKGPTARDWNIYVEALKAEEKKGIDVTRMKTIVFTDGGGPDGVQRKAVGDLLNGRPTSLAMVTDNLMFRTVVTALSWFNPRARAFSPSEVREALEFLEVNEFKFDFVIKAAEDLQKSLGLVSVKALEQARLRMKMPAVRA